MGSLDECPFGDPGCGQPEPDWGLGLEFVGTLMCAGCRKAGAVRRALDGTCSVCGGDGWVVDVENADPGGGDPGNECQIDCPQCTRVEKMSGPYVTGY